MRTFLLVLLALGCGLAVDATPGRATADSPWQQILDAPAADFTAVEMFDDALGLASTRTAMFRTTDGGATWTMPSDEIKGYAAFGFADASRVWRAGGGEIDRSDDGGQTWAPQITHGPFYTASIAVVSRDDVWVTGNDTFATQTDIPTLFHGDSVLLHTTDGGATWHPVDPLVGYASFYNVTFTGTHGWIIASPCEAQQDFRDCGRQNRALLRTNDAGATWEVATASPDFVPGAIAFPDLAHGYGAAALCPTLAPCDVSVHTSDDGGVTWKPLPDAPEGPRLRFTGPEDGWIDSGHCVVLACTGALSHTTDGGRTWTAVPLDAPVNGNFDVTSQRVVVAVSSRNLLVYDLASGQFSPAVTPAEPAFADIDFDPNSATQGYATGYSQLSRVTDDGGRSWREIDPPGTGVGLAAGTGGVVWGITRNCTGCAYRSADGGQTWTTLHGGWTSVIGLHPSREAGDGARAWLVAENGLWRTDDAGEHWDLLEPGAIQSRYVFFDHDHGFSFICRDRPCAETYRVTSDGGQTWETNNIDRPPGFTLITPDVGFATRTNRQGTLCPCTFTIIGTTDGGQSWNDLATLDTELGNLTFVDATHGWATAYRADSDLGHRVFATSDGGYTWAPEFTLPARMYADQLIPHGGVLTLRAGYGIGMGNTDRTWLYERSISEFLPPAPQAANGDAGSSTRWWAIAAGVAAGGGILALALFRVQRRRRSAAASSD